MDRVNKEVFKPIFDGLLKQHTDKAFVAEMVSIFITDGQAAIRRLETAMIQANAESIGVALHSIKNIMGALNAGNLLDLAECTLDAYKADDRIKFQTDATLLIDRIGELIASACFFTDTCPETKRP